MINQVYVEYYYVITAIPFNISMKAEGPYWKLSIMIPSDSIVSLKYRFHAEDGSGNWNETQMKTVEITDNDVPVFGQMKPPLMGPLVTNSFSG